MRNESPWKRNQTGTACGCPLLLAVTNQITSSFLSRDWTSRLGTTPRLEGEALHQAADAREVVPRWRRRPAGLVVPAGRRARVEHVVRGRQRRQVENSLDELQGRRVLVRGRLEVARLGEWGDDPGRDADAKTVGVDLRRRDVVEVTAGLVVGVDVRGTRERRGVAQPVDKLLDDAHADRDVRGRVLVPAAREAGDDPRDVGQRVLLQVLEELLLGTVCALVVRKPLPEDEDVVGVAKGDA